MADGTAASADVAGALYSNFPSRLNAITVDTVVLIATTVAFVFGVSLVQGYTAVRVILDITWWAILLFYEPLLVWRFGGTVGHRVMNIRVVDNRTRRNVSLFKALGRYAVKLALGIFSFFTMGLTRRHQALHDIITNSSVRIHDPHKAKPFQYTMGPT
jgi:uncharacterized RDD family membrane protein YckC